MKEIDEVLTDYEVMTHFNRYFQEWRMNELQDDLQDLYYQSIGKTDYDGVYGISMAATSVENIVERTCAVKSLIAMQDEKDRMYNSMLNAYLESLPEASVRVVNRYFYQQFHHGITLQHPVMDALKDNLYIASQDARADRNQKRNFERYQQAVKKAAAIKTKPKRDKIKLIWKEF
ncbi:hypothetical protein [Corticicoccus populi]|uniref:Uncharacterized protein n=1 Tax=Corticicoccus populi TaxID=1812821 RepID=A0ABW5WYA0_9STAP